MTILRWNYNQMLGLGYYNILCCGPCPSKLVEVGSEEQIFIQVFLLHSSQSLSSEKDAEKSRTDS